MLKKIIKIKIPKDVIIKNINNNIEIKGKKGISFLNLNSNLFIKIYDDYLILQKSEIKKNNKKFLGLYNSILQNKIKGVSQGFKIYLELKGLGFKVNIVNNNLILKLGFSHDIQIKIPKNIKINIIKSNKIILYGIDLGELTQFSSYIRNLKKPEPYKGKGILLKNEKINQKEGKKNKK